MFVFGFLQPTEPIPPLENHILAVFVVLDCGQLLKRLHKPRDLFTVVFAALLAKKEFILVEQFGDLESAPEPILDAKGMNVIALDPFEQSIHSQVKRFDSVVLAKLRPVRLNFLDSLYYIFLLIVALAGGCIQTSQADHLIGSELIDCLLLLQIKNIADHCLFCLLSDEYPLLVCSENIQC